VLVATDYFTKWVEAITIKIVTTGNMIDFVNEHIVYRFGIPQTITMDQESQLTLGEFEEYANYLGIKLLNSSPYMLRRMDRQKQQTKATLNFLNSGLMKVLNDGIWSLMKNYGHTRWRATA
jgi:hypothetical protein